MVEITKCVIPAAGLGTRFLPATKAMPKEMLPIIDKPVMQFVVEEAVEAGVPHILMVTGRNKYALENHFDRAFELESVLDDKGENQKLLKVVEPTELADIHYVRQGDPKGLGHAVAKARSFVGGEAFALLLGDEIIETSASLIRRMKELAMQNSVSVVALMEVERNEVSKYGIATIGDHLEHDVVEIKDFVEKPDVDSSPSNFAIIGRYVLQPGIFDLLDAQEKGLSGEIQLTDTLAKMASNPDLGLPVVGVVFTGTRYDTGDKLSFLKATIEIAISRDDIGEDLKIWLKDELSLG